MFTKLKISLFLLSLFFVANLAYAATKYIVDTPYSSSYGSSKAPGLGGGSSDDDGNTSTYEGVTCGPSRASTVAGCMNNVLSVYDGVLSEFTTSCTPCDGGFNCICPASYDKDCSGASEVGIGAPCGGKYKSCASRECTSIPNYTASLIVPYTNVSDIPRLCEAKQKRSYNGKYELCTVTIGSTIAKLGYCTPSNCSDLDSKVYTTTAADTNNSFYGNQEGICLDAGAIKYPWYCKAEYTSLLEPDCSDAYSRPKKCELEKVDKYACGYPLCAQNNMTIMSITGNVNVNATCPYSSYALQYGSADFKCYLPSKTSNVYVCKCPTAYKYTQTSCRAEHAEDPNYNASADYITSASAFDYCKWDAQKSFDEPTGKATDFYTEKYKYKTCLHACPVGLSGSNTTPTCRSGSQEVVTACSQYNNTTQIYEQKNFCLDQCPNDVDLSTSKDSLSCVSSEVVATCAKNSNGLYHQNFFCLNKCAAGLTLSDDPITSCSSGGISNICAKEVSATVKYNKLQYYCGCPKGTDGSDLYNQSCGPNEYLGGRKCTADGGIVKYENCFPKCSNAESREVKGSPELCSLPQKISDTDSDAGSGKYFCTNDTKTSVTSCSDATKYCCVVNGSAISACSTEFTAVNADESYGSKCIPGRPTQICANKDKGSAAQWQCSCVNFVDAQTCISNGSEGVGNVCNLDGVDKPKYEKCETICRDGTTLKSSIAECNAELSGNGVNVSDALGTKCYDKNETDLSKVNKFECGCPTSWQTVEGFCTPDKGANCKTEYVGIGKVCNYDLPTVGTGVTPIPYNKYFGFMKSCPVNINLTYKDSTGKCVTESVDNSVSCQKDDKLVYYCQCPSSWKTLAEYCTANPDITDCLTTYTGVGTPCTYDVADITNMGSPNLQKYKDFNGKCVLQSIRPNFEDPKFCELNPGDVITSSKCYSEDGTPRYNCICPTGPVGKEYKAMNECTTLVNGVMQVAAGKACNFDSLDRIKYEGCFNRCVNTASTPVVDRPNDCPLVGGVQAKTEICYLKAGDALPSYACRCPVSLNYMTLDAYCTIFTCPAGDAGCQGLSGGALTTYCKNNYIGVGTPCTFDVDNANKSLDKYKDFQNSCPTDRPLFYTKDECANGAIKEGVFEKVCNDRTTGQERVLCKCPPTYQSTCTAAGTELAGKTCNYEGTAIKYEGCFGKCDSITGSNGKGFEYLPEDENSDGECKDMLGDGASWGSDGRGGKCSRNHVLFNPCYCGADFVNECLSMDNEVPAEGALACSIKGTTYYNSCKNNECTPASATTAIIPLSADAVASVECQRQFGDGASGKSCGVNQAECSCSPRTYSELCSYPQTPPTGNDYCKYSQTGLMATGDKYYKLGACKVEPSLAPCGQHSISNGIGYSPSSYPTVIASTENDCKSRVGTGAQTQLCEYDSGTNKGRRAYNCYYDPSKFKATEATCPVRHILGGNYVIIGGTKTYESCDCHPAYKFHKYNCAGMLSGGACKQSTTNNNDGTIPGGVAEMDYFPYCACTADYSQVCDGERNVGVGEVCNGKYKSCVCKPDALPENWADNYYGCPGGKQPTGVIKQNGCGGKYYQCSVTECTWQHTQKCNGAYVEGVDACQDSQGNIGGYKSCRCVSGHDKLCQDGSVGKGDPCILNGEYRYKECSTEGTCVRGENKTCQEELQVGVNPCKKNNITYFEYCKCASGYDKLCENGEVGEGPSCKLNGKEYYAKCLKPTMTCTPDHKDACDTNQEKYDPCVNSENKLFYKCKCPSNWKVCAEGGAVGSETCTDSIRGQVFDECAVQNTCSVEQEKNYKICTASQKGTGGSCITIVGETTVTKYAVCEETSACRINGYKYSCLGFDSAGLGLDSCVDEGGNKLYRQCNCPSAWMTCPSKTNTKGKSCTPLLENGSSGEIVYESCTCDSSIYRYTCEKTSSNIGVKPDGGKSCTPKVPGSSTEQKPLYSSCTCEDAYKQTCNGNGHTKNGNDYCERVPGGEKLYKSCGCDESIYTETCKDNSGNPGMSGPSDASKKCTPIGVDGNPGSPVYKSCECGRYYSLLCNGTNQIAPENDFCLIKEGGADVMKYSKCLCSEDFGLTCVPSGYNKGIYPPTVGEKDTCQSVSYVNDTLIRVNHYKECKCQDAYKYTCTAADGVANATPDLYAPDNTDYCSASVESESKYTNCPCRAEYVTECKKTTENPQQEPITGAVPCNQILSNGNLVSKYLVSDCQCKAQDMTGYTAVIDTNLSSSAFKSQVKTACRHESNFVIKADGCGGTYFKCAIEDISYKYTSTSCSASTPSGSVAWEISGSSKSASVYNIASGQNNGSLTMYTNCDCPSSYVETRDCGQIGQAVLGSQGEISLFGKPYCYETGHGRNDHTSDFYGKSCSGFSGFSLVSKNSNYCINTGGTKYYVKGNCRCNTSYYVNPNCYGGWDKDNQWCQRCVDDYGTHGKVTDW